MSTHHNNKLEVEHEIILRSRAIRLVLLLFFAIFAVFLSLLVGAYSLSFDNILNAIQSRNYLQPDFQVLFALRLPRTLIALLSGYALGVGGYLIQIIFDNPLGDPYIMGISSASNLGVTLAITQGFVIAGNVMAGTVLLSLIFCLICIALVVGISELAGGRRNTMILIGIALMLFFQSISLAFQYFSSPEALKAISFWATGNMTKSDWTSCFILFTVIILCSTFLLIYKDSLSLISLGDETALSMGVNPKYLRVVVLLCLAIMVAVVVSFVGVIGFVGLMAPHLYRMIMSHDDGSKANQSGLVGAVLLLSSDIVGRVILSPIIIPVGIVTSIIGVPAFMYFLMRSEVRHDY